MANDRLGKFYLRIWDMSIVEITEAVGKISKAVRNQNSCQHTSTRKLKLADRSIYWRERDDVDYSQLGYDALVEAIKSSGARSVFMPAGSTPTGIYALMEKHQDPVFDSVVFYQVDEVVSGKKSGLFRQFFEKHLPSYQEQFHYLSDSDEQARVSRCDVSLLGIGVNGHVAFHEPGIIDSFEFGSVQLSDVTLSNLQIDSNDKVLTYGVGTFLKSEKIILLASGNSKAGVLKDAFIDREAILPVAKLFRHGSLHLIADEKALADLKQESGFYAVSGNFHEALPQVMR